MVKSCKIYFTFSSDYTSWERVLAMMAAGEIKVGTMISEITSIGNWQQAFNRLIDGEAVKILIEP